MPPVSATDTNSESKRSTKRVVYTESKWRVHNFEVVAGGGVVCRAAALRVDGALLLWVGGEGPPALGAVALAVPAPAGGDSGGCAEALATPLSGTGAELEAALALARRLARALARPVHVCCGSAFDRFTTPLVERGIITEIKSRPECF